MLSDAGKRAAYDYERWLSGQFVRKTAAFTPQSLLQRLEQLNLHMRTVDVYRMNKQLLYEYLLYLFSDDKIAVLQARSDAATSDRITEAVTRAVAPLPYYYTLSVLDRIQLALADRHEAAGRIRALRQSVVRKRQRERSLPWIALLATLLLCFLMYILYRK